jgi:4-alpha-glucanotransferase
VDDEFSASGRIPGMSPLHPLKIRDRDRDLLIAALRDQGLLLETFPDEDAPEDETVRRLIVAVERFLAGSPSQKLKVNLDDLLGETDQLNLPGTVDEYPNWRRKISAALEALP